MVRAGATSIALRVAAALIGGYAFADAVAALVSVGAPLSRPDAVVLGTMSALPAYLFVMLWAFAEQSVMRLWLWLAALTLLCLGAARMVSP